ncbi:hypothetical protein ACP4OV_005550 [Aristida adscensionis]
MGASSPAGHSSSGSSQSSLPLLAKRLLTFALYALVPLALLHCLLNQQHLPRLPDLITAATSSFSPTPPPPPPEPEPEAPPNVAAAAPAACDYSDGEWVRTAEGPRYNGTSCAGTIRDGQNCMAHGRPDTGYLHWRWRPRRCALPPFDPAAFLDLLRGRHVVFAGDSLARNQCESLVCMLASAFPAEPVRDGGAGAGGWEDGRRPRRWEFPSHGARVSVFWSPFLVNGKERSGEPGDEHHRLYLEQPDERWAAELPVADVVVLAAGHWFSHQALYYDAGGAVVGCHFCPDPNMTDTGFFGAFRLAIRNTLREVVARAGGGGGRPKLAVVTTFPPAHFEGDWDSPRACARTEPYSPEERPEEGGMDVEMWRAGAEEAAAAAAGAEAAARGVTVEALQVTRLAGLRPDGHPGVYMKASPFAGGVPERVRNDCLHWCLPGPIDTWNEILLQILRRWAHASSTSAAP